MESDHWGQYCLHWLQQSQIPGRGPFHHLVLWIGGAQNTTRDWNLLYAKHTFCPGAMNATDFLLWGFLRWENPILFLDSSHISKQDELEECLHCVLGKGTV